MPSRPVSGPRTASITPAETWPGMIGYGTPERRPCQRCTSVPQSSERSVRSSAAPGGRSGRRNCLSSMGARGAGITAARMSVTRLYVILERMLIQTLAALWVAGSMAAAPAAQAPPYKAKKARRHFISVTIDRQFVQPYAFAKHPLEELLGRPVSEVHLQPFQYQTRDGLTTVTVLEYGKRAQGFGATIYPFGSSVGATLALRASVESVPDIRVTFNGPAPSPAWQLTGGRATDIGAGLEMSDRSPGWGIGAHAFIIG